MAPKKGVKQAPISHTEKLKQDREAAKAANIAREAALAFLEADANGDGILDWDEFCVAIGKLRGKGKIEDPKLAKKLKSKSQRKAALTETEQQAEDEKARARDEEELRKLFDSIDTDKSGTIEMDEYFLWTLDIAKNQGFGLEAVFRKYDSSGEGMLDANEFALAVEDLGFTATVAHDLFCELDDDNSGSVSYAELTQTLRERAGDVSSGTKKFLTTLAFHDAQDWGDKQQVSSATGRQHSIATSPELTQAFVGPDDASLRKQLQDILQHATLRDADLYNILVTPLVQGEPTLTLTKEVFSAGMKRLGYHGQNKLLTKTFASMDTSCNGIVGFAEMREWMTGRVQRQKEARDIHLLWGRTDGIKLSQMTWSVALLKRELVAMLQRAELAPLDLVRAWDKSQDFNFSQLEFLVMMKKIILSAAAAGPDAKPTATTATDGAPEAAQTAEDDLAVDDIAGMTRMIAQATHLEKELMDKAARKLQAVFRGRRARMKLNQQEAEKLWYTDIKPVVLDVFKEIAGGDASIDLQEFVRWINTEWRAQRNRVRGGSLQPPAEKGDLGEKPAPGGDTSSAEPGQSKGEDKDESPSAVQVPPEVQVDTDLLTEEEQELILANLPKGAAQDFERIAHVEELEFYSTSFNALHGKRGAVAPFEPNSRLGSGATVSTPGKSACHFSFASMPASPTFRSSPMLMPDRGSSLPSSPASQRRAQSGHPRLRNTNSSPLSPGRSTSRPLSPEGRMARTGSQARSPRLVSERPRQINGWGPKCQPKAASSLPDLSAKIRGSVHGLNEVMEQLLLRLQARGKEGQAAASEAR